MTQDSEKREACWERMDEKDYLALTPEEGKRELIRIQALIDEDGQTPEQKADLFFEQGLLYSFAEEYGKAIASYDKSLEFKPDYHEVWNNRGIALGDLGLFEEEIASYDKALEFKPDNNDDAWWNSRGITLYNLGRLEEAIASFKKALEIKPDNDDAFYYKACCHALHSQIDQAIQNLQQAIDLNPDEWREMAKTDSDFDGMRSHTRFQALIQG